MSLEQTLKDIEIRRAGFKDRRAKIDEELAQRRAMLLADEVNQISNLIAKARAQGATLGDLKRAYGTKDHRTITTLVNSLAGEIEYWKSELLSGKHGDWFTITPSADVSSASDTVIINDVVFEIIDLADGIILSTSVPRWNEDFTIENETVGEFDGKSEDDDPRVHEIGEAWRKLDASR